MENGQEPPGQLEVQEPSSSEPGGVITKALLQDLNTELRRMEKRGRRHFLFAILGFSPAGLLPVLGLAREGAFLLAIVLCMVIIFLEGLRATKCFGKAAEIRREINEIENATNQEISGTGSIGP